MGENMVFANKKPLLRLRKNIKKLLIDHDLEWSGEFLANEIGCNRRSMSMALSGYRTGPGSERILNKLKAYLTNLP